MNALPPPASSFRARAWRWHFLAALLVVPFILWQSVTGTLYLWSYAWVDHAHAGLRFVQPAPQRTTLDAQLQAARDAMPGSRIESVLVSSDPARSTQVLFENANGLPVALFVDPYRSEALGSLDAPQWLPGWTRKLHGGWPLGDAGSWLLELGACWTLVMVLSGLVLWWPRGRGVLAALWPRFSAGRRVLWRDLHACVAVWFSLLIVGFLLTALPWTSFWGGNVLRPIQRALDQQSPQASGFAPVTLVPAAAVHERPAMLDAILVDARRHAGDGDLQFRFVDGPPDIAVSVRSQRALSSDEVHGLYDRTDGRRAIGADWSDYPTIARAVSTGVDIHEGSYFGRAGPWINTVFALALVWLCVAGAMAWWARRPAGGAGVPPRSSAPWPMWWKVGLAAMAVVMPLLGLSLVLLWCGERAWLRLFPSRSA